LEEWKTPSVAEDGDTSPVRTGEERREDEEVEGGRGRRTGSPHPVPLPADWEREEEKTRLAEDGQAVAPEDKKAP